MPRQPRVVAVGAPHHITQRGNNGQEVFLSDEDRLIYIDLIREQSRICGSALLGYCLMTNHDHLVAVPDRADSFSRALQRAHSRYTQWFNRRYQRSGHLWRNRFFSCCLDRDHLTAALVYVDLNPVRAGMVGEAQDYRWSSARAHVEGVDPWGLIEDANWRQVRTRAGWAECLRTPPEESTMNRLRMATRSGSSVAAPNVIRSLEEQTGQSLELRGRAVLGNGQRLPHLEICSDFFSLTILNFIDDAQKPGITQNSRICSDPFFHGAGGAAFGWGRAAADIDQGF